METQDCAFSVCAELPEIGTVELLNGLMPMSKVAWFAMAVSRFRDYIPVLSLYVNGRRVEFVTFDPERMVLSSASLN